MLTDHIREPTKVTQKSLKYQSEQWTNVHFTLFFGQPNAQFVTQHWQASVHIANDLSENLIHRLQNEFNKAALG